MAKTESQHDIIPGMAFGSLLGPPNSLRMVPSSTLGMRAPAPGQGGPATAADWLGKGWDSIKHSAVEAADRLAKMSPEDLGRLRKMLGPTGSFLGVGAAGLEAYERYRNHEPLDEIAVRELAKLGLSTAGAEMGGEGGGALGAMTGPFAPGMVPLLAGGGAVAGGMAGDWVGDRIGDTYRDIKTAVPRTIQQLQNTVGRGLQDLHDRYDPQNRTYDQQGQRIYDR